MELPNKLVARLLALLATAKEPLPVRSISSALGLETGDRRALYQALDTLRRTGKVARLRGDRFALSSGAGSPQRPCYVGHLFVNPRGFGFVTPERALGSAPRRLPASIFVAPDHLGGALHGDSVELEVLQPGPRPTGVVRQVLSRARTRLSGHLRTHGDKPWIEPDDPHLPALFLAPDGNPAQLPEGSRVAAEILRFPGGREGTMLGHILAPLGDPDDPRAELDRLLLLRNLAPEHPEDAQREALAVSRPVDPSAHPDREDLRALGLVTIDGQDAKDFDDAVAAQLLPGGEIRVTVAIADVAHYVQAGGALDREAYARGTSVYPPGMVLPMLPPILSDDLCSLRPHQDRLCLAVSFTVGPSGERHTPRFVEALMRSSGRLTYEEVSTLLDQRPGWRDALPHLLPYEERLLLLHRAARWLRQAREQRGAIDLDLPEAQIHFDPHGEVISITRRPRQEAHRVIEDLMLAANELTAEHLRSHARPAPLRIHESPDPSKLESFAAAAQALGAPFTAGTGTDEDPLRPSAIQAYLRTLQQHPAAQPLQALLLRSLKQARYAAQPLGHFALAAPDYLHVTSPIRRYPDLMAHRALKALLRQDAPPPLSPPPPLDEACTHASQQERRAAEAEREATELWRAHHMKQHLGAVFTGRVSGIVAAGMFVSLDQPFVDGFIPVEDIPGDAFAPSADGVHLVGQRSNARFTLGDPVHVKVLRASVPSRRIELSLLG